MVEKTFSRKKKFAPRSRTGCRTCRIRRIKCDETPSSCKNCASAGWECEGVDSNRPPHQMLPKGAPSPSLSHIARDLPGETREERRGFAFFSSSTVTRITALFDCSLWTDLILPMGHVDDAVGCAIVGLSALHEDLEVRGVPRAREDLTSHRYRFSLQQYTRSLSSLNRRRHSHDPRLRDVTLVCCLLFVIFELLRGQYDLAFMHLRQGLSIVKENMLHPDRFSKCLVDGDSALVRAMMRLDAQSVLFDVAEPCFDLPRAAAVPHGSHLTTGLFVSVLEARLALDSLFSNVSRFLVVVNSLPQEERLGLCHPDLRSRKQHLHAQLDAYLIRLDQSKDLLQLSNGAKDRLSVEFIRLHHKTLSVLLDTINFNTSHSADHSNDFREILSISRAVYESFAGDNNNKPLPTLLLDMGIIAPLFYVCSDCHDAQIRREALHILESWPHHEGPWDSRLTVVFAKHLFAIESDAAGSGDGWDTTGSVQVDDAFLHVEDDQYHAVLSYRYKGSEALPKKKSILNLKAPRRALCAQL